MLGSNNGHGSYSPARDALYSSSPPADAIRLVLLEAASFVLERFLAQVWEDSVFWVSEEFDRLETY